MKQIILILLLANFTAASFGQFPAHVDSLYTFIKSNSVHRNKVDWRPIDKDFRTDLASAHSLKDTMNSFVHVLKKLNDVHSQLYLNNQYYGHYPTLPDSILAWLKPMNDKAISLTNTIRTAWLADHFGYIRVPGIQVFDKQEINKYAQALQDSIYQFTSKKTKGFIVDLRLNGGGNIYPMLSGLSPLLGDGIIAYETDLKDSIIRRWEIKGGNFVLDGYQTTETIGSKKTPFREIPVVVLISSVTKSSGSMTAIAFKHRLNTFFIGQPTADGYTTSNGFFQFAPNLQLNFATNFVADRYKLIYKSVVRPDIHVYRGDDFDDLENDAKIKLAINWLTKASARSL